MKKDNVNLMLGAVGVFLAYQALKGGKDGEGSESGGIAIPSSAGASPAESPLSNIFNITFPEMPLSIPQGETKKTGWGTVGASAYNPIAVSGNLTYNPLASSMNAARSQPSNIITGQSILMGGSSPYSSSGKANITQALYPVSVQSPVRSGGSGGSSSPTYSAPVRSSPSPKKTSSPSPSFGRSGISWR